MIQSGRQGDREIDDWAVETNRQIDRQADREVYRQMLTILTGCF